MLRAAVDLELGLGWRCDAVVPISFLEFACRRGNEAEIKRKGRSGRVDMRSTDIDGWRIDDTMYLYRREVLEKSDETRFFTHNHDGRRY